MSRSHKKFPCYKACLPHGKKIANKTFRHVCKNEMRHYNYDMLPTKFKKTTNSYNVCEYKSICNRLIGNKSPYYECKGFDLYYYIIYSISDIDKQLFFNALKFTKFGLYKTFVMK